MCGYKFKRPEHLDDENVQDLVSQSYEAQEAAKGEAEECEAQSGEAKSHTEARGHGGEETEA